MEGLVVSFQEVQAALAATPFTACTGESLVAANPSLLVVRPMLLTCQLLEGDVFLQAALAFTA